MFFPQDENPTKGSESSAIMTWRKWDLPMVLSMKKTFHYYWLPKSFQSERFSTSFQSSSIH